MEAVEVIIIEDEAARFEAMGGGGRCYFQDRLRCRSYCSCFDALCLLSMLWLPFLVLVVLQYCWFFDSFSIVQAIVWTKFCFWPLCNVFFWFHSENLWTCIQNHVDYASLTPLYLLISTNKCPTTILRKIIMLSRVADDPDPLIRIYEFVPSYLIHKITTWIMDYASLFSFLLSIRY